ncbi:Ig-like domain-containing protein, partial [Paenimyroides baculatum]|uniref:Ig-like domain-containing protein n=1 Tax=Paenimyroides baculatum TaxID=2608000 RepID=UPI0016804338
APTGGTIPYTYLWNTGATGATLSNLAAGTYSVTITDTNGCTGTESITITQPAVLIATNSAQTDVSWYGGNDGSATVSVAGGTAPYTYLWSNGATGATASNLIAGTYTVTVTDANGCTSAIDFVITQPIPLMVQSVSQTNVSCNAGANGTAGIVAMGGNAPYTYLWSNGATASTVSNLSAGVYTVTVTDSTLNIITESFTITEPLALATTMAKTDITCNFASNGTATVSVIGGTSPYTYFWSNGMTSANATNLNVGNYTVSITDANGCKTTATVSITQPTALVAAVTSTNISCYGQVDGTASVIVSGGTAPYTYSWSNGQTGTSLTSLAKGSYILTVSDANNCTITQSFTITEPAFVHPPVAVNQSFCIGQNATLANMVITGSNIKWYNAANGGTLLPGTTVLTTGTTYYASQTVGTCESATRTGVQVTLNQGTPLTTTQLNVCSNTRVQNMTIDGFNYTQLRWYSSSTSTVQLPSSQLLTTATYYVSSVVGTCESTRQAIQVTVAAAVAAPTATSQVMCGNSTLNDVVVVKDPSATLKWYTSLQSMIPLAGTTQVSTGTYYVQQVIGACESVRIAVSVQVTSVSAPIMTSIATCDGNTIADLHPSTGTYVWYVNNTTTTALPDTFVIKSGTYYISHEVSGCISPRTNVSVNVNARPASATGQSNQLFGFAARVSDLQMNQSNVSWFASFNDAVKQVNQLASTHPLQDQTTYYGILTGANNCGSAVPTAVTVTINLSNAELDLTQLKYYPNPVDSELNISYIEEIKKVEVFTITGQRVFGNDYQGNEVKVDLSRLSAGNYLVKIETAKASQFVKIVKK